MIRNRLLIALIEVGGAAWITYQQMPEHQRQRVRMRFYQHAAHLARVVAHRAGAFGIVMEHKYHEEVSANG